MMRVLPGPRLSLLLAAAIAGAGLLAWLSRSPGESDRDREALLRERAEREFASGELLRPAEGAGAAAGLERDLMPLLLIETPEGATPVEFGAIAVRDEGLAVHPSEPVLYAGRSTVVLRGKELPQLAYVWWQRGEGGRWLLQGVRMTFAADSMPLVWEVFRDASGLRPIYVSRRVEEAARREIGPPPEGRRFAVERPPGEAPGFAVARVLADAPQPLGPWVYQAAGSLDVTTLLCRCMPSQVREVAPAREYVAVPLEDLELTLEEVLWELGGEAAAADLLDPGRLDHALRLPPSIAQPNGR